MEFELIPVLDQIKALYDLPLAKRFDHYLFLLQGDSKQDMILPIAGFNPLAKQKGKDKLQRLISLGAEEIANETIKIINAKNLLSKEHNVKVAINLIDDIEGAWSHYFATNYKSNFDITSLLKRNFCTPCFWTSEDLNEDIIRIRIQNYLFRYIHAVQEGSPKTLSDLVKQEVFVASFMRDSKVKLLQSELDRINAFYIQHQNSKNYDLLLNFFYGDLASESLSLSGYGLPANAGFIFAQYMSTQKKQSQLYLR